MTFWMELIWIIEFNPLNSHFISFSQRNKNRMNDLNHILNHVKPP